MKVRTPKLFNWTNMLHLDIIKLHVLSAMWVEVLSRFRSSGVHRKKFELEIERYGVIDLGRTYRERREPKNETS